MKELLKGEFVLKSQCTLKSKQQTNQHKEKNNKYIKCLYKITNILRAVTTITTTKSQPKLNVKHIKIVFYITVIKCGQIHSGVTFFFREK